MGRSKRYSAESEQVTKDVLSLQAGVEKIKSFKSVKFDQSVECVMHLGINPKQADQMVRGSISLPHGIGKQKSVMNFLRLERTKQQFQAYCRKNQHAD